MHFLSRFLHSPLGLSCSLAVLVAFASTGCGSHGNRAAVSGEVQLDGKPLMQGAIKFSPLPGVAGEVTGTQIKDGRYHVPQAIGPSPGWHSVEVTAMRK